MILDLAGFRIKLVNTSTVESLPFLNTMHQGLKCVYQPEFLLRIHYSDHQLFDRPEGSCISMQESNSDENVNTPIKVWMDFDGKRILIQGWPESSGSPCWECILEPGQKIGMIRHPAAYRNRDPLAYPVDHLILYYLSLWNQAIILHASGISFSGNGALFTGLSGAGKSTIAYRCTNAGARLIHDDRMLLRKFEKEQITGYRMPSYPGQSACSSRVTTVFAIKQERQFSIQTLSEHESLELLMQHSVQFFYHPDLLNRQYQTFQQLVKALPFYLVTLPDDPGIGHHLRKIIESHAT